MIPGLSSLYKYKIGLINFFCCLLTLLCLWLVGCLSLENLNKESLVSSSLNSNLLRFQCVHPNVHTTYYVNKYYSVSMRNTNWHCLECSHTKLCQIRPWGMRLLLPSGPSILARVSIVLKITYVLRILTLHTLVFLLGLFCTAFHNSHLT